MSVTSTRGTIGTRAGGSSGMSAILASMSDSGGGGGGGSRASRRQLVRRMEGQRDVEGWREGFSWFFASRIPLMLMLDLNNNAPRALRFMNATT